MLPSSQITYHGAIALADYLVAFGVVDDPQDVDEHNGTSLRRPNETGDLLGLD